MAFRTSVEHQYFAGLSDRRSVRSAGLTTHGRHYWRDPSLLVDKNMP